MIEVIDCDFTNPKHCKAFLQLMNDYRADEMGDYLPPYDADQEKKVLDGLAKHPSKLVLLVKEEEKFVGLCNCFINFGTFAAKPFINIHDVVVLKTYRGKGIGKILFEEITRRAKSLDCAKITLEVRADNVYAQKLYSKMAYHESQPPMHFWTKYL